MADSFNKKEREKKRQKRKKEKAERKAEKKLGNAPKIEFMYVDADGNLTAEKPDTLQKRVTKIEDVEISTPKKGKSDESKFVKQGFVKFFNTEKGYGFIVDNDTNESYFVHVDGLKQPIKDNDKVTFEVGKGPKGPIAVDVKILAE